jgi:hypothetical protein
MEIHTEGMVSVKPEAMRAGCRTRMPSVPIIVGGRNAEMIMGVRVTALRLGLLRLGIAGDTPEL